MLTCGVRWAVLTNYGVVFAVKNVKMTVEVELEVEVSKVFVVCKLKLKFKLKFFSLLLFFFFTGIFGFGYLNVWVTPYKKRFGRICHGSRAVEVTVFGILAPHGASHGKTAILDPIKPPKNI